jgi:tetratricopeptide (TPR) repeat protein
VPTPGSPSGPTPAASALSARDGWLILAGALALRAAAFRPGLPPAPPEAILAGPETGAALFGLRLAAVLAGSLAALLVAWTGARLAGRAAGLGAGWLLALTPFAVRNAGWLGPPGVLVASAALALFFLARWVDGRRPADLVGMAVGVAAGAWGLRMAPLTSLADPDVLSPLGEGLVQAGRIAGPVAAVLAAAGALAAFRTGHRAAKAVAGATAAGALIALLRQGADPNSLAVVVPGAALLAAVAAARPRDVLPGLPAMAGRAVFAAALLLALGSSARAIAVSRSASPARDAERWMATHLPDGLPVLYDEPDLEVPAMGPDGTGFNPVRVPPAGSRAEDAPAFYQAELARRFPVLVLRDPPATAGPVRREFWRFFREEWHEGFRTGEGEYPLSAVTVLARPEGWEPDSAKIARVDERLREGQLPAMRDTSRTYAEWIVGAARAMRNAGALGEAQAFLDLAQERADWRAEVFFEQGLLHLLAQRRDLAMSSMLDALQRDPRHGGAHFNLGTLLEIQGDVRGAETEYRAAIVNLEDPVPAHVRLGELLAALGRLDEARGELDRVRRLRPGSQEQAVLEQALRDAGDG